MITRNKTKQSMKQKQSVRASEEAPEGSSQGPPVVHVSDWHYFWECSWVGGGVAASHGFARSVGWG